MKGKNVVHDPPPQHYVLMQILQLFIFGIGHNVPKRLPGLCPQVLEALGGRAEGRVSVDLHLDVTSVFHPELMLQCSRKSRKSLKLYGFYYFPSPSTSSQLVI